MEDVCFAREVFLLYLGPAPVSPEAKADIAAQAPSALHRMLLLHQRQLQQRQQQHDETFS